MTTMSSAADQQFEVRDNSKPLTFTGVQLAASSSNFGSDLRWTELTLYRTATGKYVLQKVGRSVIFHSDRCKRRSKGDRYDGLSDVREVKDFEPCADCHPSTSVTPVWVERDLFQAVVHEDAASLTRSLHRTDNDGVPYMSRVARTLLETASVSDDKISQAFNAAVDVT